MPPKPSCDKHLFASLILSNAEESSILEFIRNAVGIVTSLLLREGAGAARGLCNTGKGARTEVIGASCWAP